MKTLFTKIDKSFIAPLPKFEFGGRIVIIQSELEARRAVEVLLREQLVGIDTETRPSFRKGETHKVALLQVATSSLCFLFRLNRIGFCRPLIRLLSDERVTKVGLSLKDDIHMLSQRHAFTPGRFIDLQDTAKHFGIEDMSLQKLFANVFHQKISKRAQLSNWEAPTLTEAQQRYAATDAYACLLLHDAFNQFEAQGNYQLLPVSSPALTPDYV